MGCLVSRLVLESPKYKNATWFSKIKQIICICGPHTGAPIALGRALGCEGVSLGVSVPNMRLIENDPRYPAGFQCFPMPGIDVLYNVSTSPAVSVDVYGLAADTTYQLKRANVLAAAASWSQLPNIDDHPKQISYTCIAGTGMDTSSAYLFDGTRFVQTITQDGDGTVPAWSAEAGKYVTHYNMVGDHVGIMGTLQLKQTLDEIFGLPLMSAFQVGQAGVSLLVNKHTFRAGEMMQVIVIPDTPTQEIDGKLTLAFVASVSSKSTSSGLVPYGTGTSVSYRGPEISHLSTRLLAPHLPGAYVLKFAGTHRSTESSSAVFFVSAASTASIHSAKKINHVERVKATPGPKKIRGSRSTKK
jgi:hypothetical protein